MTPPKQSEIEAMLSRQIIDTVTARGAEIMEANPDMMLMHAHYLAWSEFKAKHLNEAIRRDEKE